MRDEQVQQLLCLLNHYACLCLLLFLPAYLQIDWNFSQGYNTSTPPAALPVLHSGPHQCQAPLLTHTLTTQLSNPNKTRIIKMLLSNAPHFLGSLSLSPHQTPNGAQLPLESFLESYTAELALLQSHPGLYCTLYLPIYTVMTFHLLILLLLSSSVTKPYLASFPSGLYQGLNTYWKTMGPVKNREIMPWHNVHVVKMWPAYLGGLCLLHVHEQTEQPESF